jgi:hypothetical protein
MLDLSQPTIYIFNIRVDEPVTTVTDLIISFICFYSFFRLNQYLVNTKLHKYLKVYFISMGIATALGGLLGHGFLYFFSYPSQLLVSPWKLPGWITSMISIAMIERVSIEYARKLIKPRIGSFFAWLNIIELIVFMGLTFSTLNFFFVELHTTYGLLFIVAGFNGYNYYKTRSAGSKLFLYAVAVSAISALVYLNKWGISKWFNHFDISHVLLAVAALLFMKGSLKLIKE